MTGWGSAVRVERGSSASPPRRSPPKAVKCLLPVWGHRYTSQFLEFGLPTLLARGNIPALAAALPCEFVVATSSEDAPMIREHPNWRLLANICPTRLTVIDDLICDASYSTSLTLAYSRVMRATGEGMLDCCFLFLVADFLVADGSLMAVLKRLQAGASGVLAGNFQIAAEKARLHLFRRSPGALSLAPRALLRLSFAHLHPSTRIATVNDGFDHASTINRLFWRVDRNTMLGRFYLTHMIGIRPEVQDFVIGSACDYSFIPEMCPSGQVEMMTDSDEYCVVEMQPSGHDTAIRPQREPLDTKRLAADLSKWTTSRHRENARTTVLFHAEDLPAATVYVVSRADTAIREIEGALSPIPCSNRGHPYWIGGLALYRATTGRSLDAELGHRSGGQLLNATALLWRLRLFVFGRPPSVRPWHPRSPDFTQAWNLLTVAAKQPKRLLIVANEPRTFEYWLRPIATDVTALDLERLQNGAPSMPAEPFDACLTILTADEFASSAPLFANISSLLDPISAITVLVTKNSADELSLFSRQIVAVAEAVLRQDGWRVDSRCVRAGPVRRAIQGRLIQFTRTARTGSRAYLPLFAIAWAGLSLASYACNLVARRPVRGSSPNWCSSMVLTLRRINGTESSIDPGRFRQWNSTSPNLRTRDRTMPAFRRQPIGSKTLCRM